MKTLHILTRLPSEVKVKTLRTITPNDLVSLLQINVDNRIYVDSDAIPFCSEKCELNIPKDWLQPCQDYKFNPGDEIAVVDRYIERHTVM